jgi:hypothetical protein
MSIWFTGDSPDCGPWPPAALPVGVIFALIGRALTGAFLGVAVARGGRGVGGSRSGASVGAGRAPVFERVRGGSGSAL